MSVEILKDMVAKTRQERLLNPQVSDHFLTILAFTYGSRFYEVKVGRKWVHLKSNAHKKRLSIEAFKTLARKNWIADAKTDAIFKNLERTGKFKLPNKWWLEYGFDEKPLL